MAVLNFRVDTDPMAYKVSEINSSVLGVGTTVIELQKELINAEIEAAEKVSNNVTYGFYMLTRNQLTQKLVDFENKATNAYVLYQNYSKDLKQIKERMEKDYNLISRQYLKIFKSIENTLNTLVNDLDSALLDITSTSKDVIVERRTSNTSVISNYNSGIIPMTNALSISVVKEKVARIIEESRRYLLDVKELEDKINYVVSAAGVKDKTQIFIPVLVSVEDSFLDNGGLITNMNMPSFPESSSNIKGDIQTKVISSLSNNLKWVDRSPADKSGLDSSFRKILEKETDPRKKETMMNLFKKATLQKLEG